MLVELNLEELFEVDGVTEEVAQALYKAGAKLPIKTKFVKDNDKKTENKKLTKDQAEKIDYLKRSI